MCPPNTSSNLVNSIFACRNEAKTTVVIEEIKKETGNAKLEFIEIDMLSLDSIKTFIDTFKSKYTQLDLLLNNAGLFSYPPTTSEDGLDAQFQVNHLALFYLTTALLPILENTKSSRVVNVGSAAHNAVFGEIDFAKMNKPENHGSNQHYCVSKCCTNLFTFELARRLEEKGEKVRKALSFVLSSPQIYMLLGYLCQCLPSRFCAYRFTT